MAENRAARRAASKSPAKGKRTLEGFQLLLTADEARLAEEAMDALRRTMREDLGEDVSQYTEQQKWAYLRAQQLGNYLASAVAGYTYRAPSGSRVEPSGLVQARAQAKAS